MKASILLALCAMLFSLSFAPGSPGLGFDLHGQATEISEGFWVSKYEVSQREYKLFLADLEANGDVDLARQFLPDTNVWKGTLDLGAYSSLYFRHPAFDDYPVVGITHTAAQAYCAWMTAKVARASVNRPHSDGATYRFRLPTEQEWLAAAGDNRPGKGVFPGGYGYPRDHKGRFVFNHKLGKGNFAGYAGGKGHDYEGYMITAPVKSFFPDANGLHNMTGNVAEMLAEPGMAKGGSWNHLPDDCRYESVQHYEAASAWLGFRMVVERL